MKFTHLKLMECMKIYKINFTLLATIMFLFIGCTIRIPAVTQIPQQNKVEKINHSLLEENKQLIKQQYIKYKDGLVVGLITAIENKNKKKAHEEKYQNVDLSKETLYECHIKQIRGKPDSFFHKMFLITDNVTQKDRFSVVLNYNDVNDFIIYDRDNSGSLYLQEDSSYRFVVANMDGMTASSVYLYQCGIVTNFIF